LCADDGFGRACATGEQSRVRLTVQSGLKHTPFWTHKAQLWQFYLSYHQTICDLSLRLFGRICRMSGGRNIKSLAFGMTSGNNKVGWLYT